MPGVIGTNETAERHLLTVLLAALSSSQAAQLTELAAVAGDPLLAVARRHRLTPLVSVLWSTFSSMPGGGLPAGFAEACRRDRVITAARNLMLGQAAEECLRAFAAADVPVIVLKGIAYERSLYSNDGARPTADIDLLVPAKARRAAFAVLDRLGFEPRAAAPGFDDDDYHEVAWSRGNVEVDLHLALAPYARCRIDYGEVWGRAAELTVGAAAARMLDLRHAAVFHALHMAIDHFDVPALYLVDFSRQLASPAAFEAAEATARAWGCWRPFATAAALTGAFLPAWRAGNAPRAVPGFAAEVVEHYGPIAPLPRPRQLLRKLAHFDDPLTALRYVAVQARRNAHELIERRIRKRSARERLTL
jgi:hypothetical protein